MPLTSSGLRSGRRQSSEMGGEGEEGSSPLNLDSLRRRRTTKGLPRFGSWEGRGGWGGYVKLTAALNPSSWQWLNPIRPGRPRTTWQGLSFRRHQWTDEDCGQSVRPCVAWQTCSFREKTVCQQFSLNMMLVYRMTAARNASHPAI